MKPGTHPCVRLSIITKIFHKLTCLESPNHGHYQVINKQADSLFGESIKHTLSECFLSQELLTWGLLTLAFEHPNIFFWILKESDIYDASVFFLYFIKDITNSL